MNLTNTQQTFSSKYNPTVNSQESFSRVFPFRILSCEKSEFNELLLNSKGRYSVQLSTLCAEVHTTHLLCVAPMRANGSYRSFFGVEYSFMNISKHFFSAVDFKAQFLRRKISNKVYKL